MLLILVYHAGRAARAGRLGTALSMLTPEELPYALDLHLFLGKRLQPAPVCSLADAAAAAGTADPQGASLYGSFPQVGCACLLAATGPAAFWLCSRGVHRRPVDCDVLAVDVSCWWTIKLPL